jgi:hypothetical protein
MTRPSPEELLGETARLAYHLHWPLETILDLEHADRRRFLAEAEGLAAESAPVYEFAALPEPEPLQYEQPHEHEHEHEYEYEYEFEE